MRQVMIICGALALVVGSPALADPGGGNGRKHGGGPPGLEKKPHGMPPGQAKKMWRRGERLPSAYYTETRYIVVQPDRYHLRPPPAGYRWVLVEDDAYLVRGDDGLVAEMVAGAIANLVR